jgi:hypothetical protein
MVFVAKGGALAMSQRIVYICDHCGREANSQSGWGEAYQQMYTVMCERAEAVKRSLCPQCDAELAFLKRQQQQALSEWWADKPKSENMREKVLSPTLPPPLAIFNESELSPEDLKSHYPSKISCESPLEPNL